MRRWLGAPWRWAGLFFSGAVGLAAAVMIGPGCGLSDGNVLSWTAEYASEELEQDAVRWLLRLHEGSCEQLGQAISTWDMEQGVPLVFSRPGPTGHQALRLLVLDDQCQTIGEGCTDLAEEQTRATVKVQAVSPLSFCPAAFCHQGRCQSDNAHENESRGRSPRCDSPRQDVPEGHDGARHLALGSNHSCALMAGEVRCWGRNHAGQLGLGNQDDTGQATPVAGLEAVQSLAAGHDFTCALLEAGTVWCWGRNSSGQLGDGTFDDRTRPVQVVDLADAVGIAAGGAHACARTNEKKVFCWGDNDHGQLGDGTTSLSTRPVEVENTSRTISLAAAGSTTCIVEHCGHLRCFGMNATGARGEENLADLWVPSGGVLHPVSFVSLGWWSGGLHALAIRLENRLYSWGNNDAGQLGDGTFDGRWEPEELEITDAPVQVAAGDRFSCFLSREGKPSCWGTNGQGQLGLDAAGLAPTALNTGGLPVFDEIAAGASHACVRAGDLVWCWGDNSYHKRGDGAYVEGTFLAEVPLWRAPAE